MCSAWEKLLLAKKTKEKFENIHNSWDFNIDFGTWMYKPIIVNDLQDLEISNVF